jgi:hypothetical protein
MEVSLILISNFIKNGSKFNFNSHNTYLKNQDNRTSTFIKVTYNFGTGDL